MQSLDKTLLVCPTYNPGDLFDDWLRAYQAQTAIPAKALIVDSSSDDGSVSKAADFGFTITSIPKNTFNHGGTRKQAVDDNSEYEYVIFMTQDAILSDKESLLNILAPFKDEQVAAVCGRQLPRKLATPIEAHARLYNYPSHSHSRSINDSSRLGLKTAFISNSFAAYRVSALVEVAGFPENVIFGEDMYVATKMLKAGYRIAYVTDATVFHSHEYTFRQEFRRCFDMGVFHARAPWIRQQLGGAEGEGLKFVESELRYLLRRQFWRLPESIIRSIFRYVGFRLGLLEKKIHPAIKTCMTMNKGYFQRKNNII